MPANSTCAAVTSTAATTYSADFRDPRDPVESANFGRNFRIKERMSMFIRAEFVNIFKRTILLIARFTF